MLTTNKAVYGTDGSLTELGKLKSSVSGNVHEAKVFSFENVADGILIDYKDIRYYTYTCYRYISDDELEVHQGILFYDEGLTDELGSFTDPHNVESIHAYFTDNPNYVLIKDETTYTKSFVILNGWK